MILRHELNCHAHIVDAKKKKKKTMGRKEGKMVDYVPHAHTFIRNLNLKCINL